MDFKIDADSNDERRTRRPPPNYSSGPVRFRLATLIVMLGLAILSMNEAGKPKTWERLGFTSPPPAVEQSIEVVELTDITRSETPDEIRDTALDQFWSTQFEQMSMREKKLLLGLLQYARDVERVPVDLKDQAIELVEVLRIRFNDSATVNENRFTPEQEIEFELSYKMLADAAAGRKNDSRNKDIVSGIQTLFDKHLYAMVEDRSSLSRSAESLAWIRTWNRIATLKATDEPEEVSYIQLAGQPGAWRGKPIAVKGVARGIESVAASNPELDIASYNVLWVKPAGSGRTPYCVYVKELPPGFPAPNGKFQAINKPVRIDGIFFKLRSYVASNEKIETCPLILADTIQMHPVEVVETTGSWTPPLWLLTMFFIGMPVVAALLAFNAYRSTKTSRFMPGKNSQREIAESLSAMVDNSSIKTDQEKVRELNETKSQNH